jgi:drug/metabolite transporter (DMT)-like permease
MRDVADGFDATAVGVMRIPSAMITLAAIALLTPSSALRRRSVPLSSGWALAIAGVTGAGIGSLLFIVAVQEIGAGETAVLSSLSPLFALPLAAVVLGERITPWLLVGVSIALAGIILLSV